MLCSSVSSPAAITATCRMHRFPRPASQRESSAKNEANSDLLKTLLLNDSKHGDVWICYPTIKLQKKMHKTNFNQLMTPDFVWAEGFLDSFSPPKTRPFWSPNGGVAGEIPGYFREL